MNHLGHTIDQTDPTRIKDALRRIVSALPGGDILISRRRYFYQWRRYSSRLGSPEQVFRHHYEVNTGAVDESVCRDPGSTIQYTENIRRVIPELVRQIEVREILDAPCGDYNWFRMIDWETEISYTGGDIVKALVERNQALYGSKNRKFVLLDIVHGVLPRADLWLCRDCLMHLPNRDVMFVLNNFLNSNIRYLLTTTHPNHERNEDIPAGAFRLLNLELPPFNLCKPIRAIDDWIEGHPVRYLALWERDMVADSLASNESLRKARRRR